MKLNRSLNTAASPNICDNERMAKPAEALTQLFDPALYLPDGIGEIVDHQTALPRIAKDRSLITAIEEKLEQIPTQHDLYLADARKIDFGWIFGGCNVHARLVEHVQARV